MVHKIPQRCKNNLNIITDLSLRVDISSLHVNCSLLNVRKTANFISTLTFDSIIAFLVDQIHQKRFLHKV